MGQVQDFFDRTAPVLAQELCAHCSTANNIAMCRPRAAESGAESQYEEEKTTAGWIGPTIGHLERTADTCALCRVVYEHLKLREEPSFFEGDPDRRVCLNMVNERGYQSDGVREWQEVATWEGAAQSPGVAAIEIGIESEPGNCTWDFGSDITYALRIYAPKTCSTKVAGIVKRKEVDEELSTSTLTKIRGWLNECIDNHWQCRTTTTGVELDETPPEPVQLPTRVITVSDGKWAVRATHGQRGRYLALSYCWGEDEENYIPFKLQAHNVAEFAQERELDSSVPKTYRDAMLLTQALGLQYLWIDALCIIQGDSADWEREAGRMASIYEHATITAAAIFSRSNNDGLFDRAKPTATAAIPWLECDSCGEWQKIDHIHAMANFPMQRSSDSAYKPGALHKGADSKWAGRGWVFQELGLSRREILFGKYHVHWTCLTHERSEDEWDEKVRESYDNKYLSRQLAFVDHAAKRYVEELNDWLAGRVAKAEPRESDSPQVKGQKRKTRWINSMLSLLLQVANSPSILRIGRYLQTLHDRCFGVDNLAVMSITTRLLIPAYCTLGFTKVSDRAVAFGGLGKAIGQRAKQEYHWGIWTKGVAYGMYWSPDQGSSAPVEPPAAPSWSWLSHLGGIVHGDNSYPFNKLIQLQGANGDLSHIEFVDHNFRVKPYNGLQPQSIQLQGHLASAVQSQNACAAYPDTQRYLFELLRLHLRDGFDGMDSETVPHLLFIDCEPMAGRQSQPEPIMHECRQCKQSINASNEYRTINHIEACHHNTEPDNVCDHQCLKLSGLTLFDNPTNAPASFKVLLLSHARDTATSWQPREPLGEAPTEPPYGFERILLHPSAERAFGVQWSPCESQWEKVRWLWTALRIYKLLLITESKKAGKYIRVGVGVGYYLPGCEIFGGVDFQKLAPRSDLTIV